jgi:hypothetical protein
MIQAGLAEADVGSAYPNAKLYGGHGALSRTMASKSLARVSMAVELTRVSSTN